MTPPAPPSCTHRAGGASSGLFLRVFLPFAAGYYLSYLYRTVNAVISPDLVSALGLSAEDLGLLTSVYFLTFAAAQLPLGILLDRFGPRRVEAFLLVFAAAGSLIFSLSGEREGLIVGRALVGLGVSSCLMASFKAFVLWFPLERIPTINGGVYAAGGLGALTATYPVEAALGITDWRGLFMGLAVATMALSVVIYLVVPERAEHSVKGGLPELTRGLIAVFRSQGFWRIAPLTFMTQGSFLAIQGLWLGPWLKDVAGMERDTVAMYLFFTAAAMVAGFLSMGKLAERLARSGIRTVTVAGAGMFAFMLVELSVVLGPAVQIPLLWVLFGFFGTAGSLSYAVVSQAFPAGLVGRANTALNLLVFAGAFLAQWGIGAVINLWPVTNGTYDPRGYTAAFGLCFALQGLSLAWFLLVERMGAAGRNRT